MSDIKNNTPRTPLGLPDGTVIAPGETKPVSNWDTIKENAVVKAWLRAGILSEVSAKVEAVESAANDETETVEDEPADDKDTILAKLADLGIKKDRRSSLASLQAALQEAQEA